VFEGSILEKKNIILHSSFLINLAVDDERKRKRAIGMAKYTVKVGEMIGCNSIVFHAGSGLPSILMHSLQEVLTVCSKRSPRILVENDCGGGKRIGSIRVLTAVKYFLEGQVGICFDTMHSYGRGETLNLEALKKVYEYCRPELIHLNSPNPECSFGDHRDRHKCILNEGRYEEDIFEFAVWVGNQIPMIIEAPIDIALIGVQKLEEFERKRDGSSGI